MTEQLADTLAPLAGLLPDLEKLYTHIHANPELSGQETRTAALAAAQLKQAGFDVTGHIGGTGVVGILRNGDGPVVLMRADMDALPVEEATGVAYQSRVTAALPGGGATPVMHACGHDMHVTWLIGAATLLARAKAAWRGTLLCIFQPAEETAGGAEAMVADGLFDRVPKPDVAFAQHVMVGPAGVIGQRAGAITSAAGSLQIRLIGRGAHGSMPQASIDPVVMASATVLRLQTIVAREVAPDESAVLTVGSLQAGTKENVIPDDAILRLNVRTFDEGVRARVLAAIQRIVKAEAAASGAPEPEFTPLDRYPLGMNDAPANARLADAFRAHFGADRVHDVGPASASEDFGVLPAAVGVPSVYWFVGGTDPVRYAEAKAANRLNDLPTNHNPHFLPVLNPTLQTGVETMVVAALTWMPA